MTASRMPTVGRIVLVGIDPAVNNGADRAPAIITRVFTPECVNLRVMVDGPGEMPWRTSSTLCEPEDLAGTTAKWAWPPLV